MVNNNTDQYLIHKEILNFENEKKMDTHIDKIYIKWNAKEVYHVLEIRFFF